MLKNTIYSELNKLYMISILTAVTVFFNSTDISKYMCAWFSGMGKEKNP